MAQALKALNGGSVDHYQKKSVELDEEISEENGGKSQPSEEVIKEIRQKVQIINKGILVDVVGIEENVNGGETMFTVKVNALVEAGGGPHFANIKLRFSPQALAKFLVVTKKAASKQ